jgi:PBP1b-binding outer membrane lipoprotein LpoB
MIFFEYCSHRKTSYNEKSKGVSLLKIYAEDTMKKLIIPLLTSAVLLVGCSSDKDDKNHVSEPHKEPRTPTLQYKVGSNDWSAITSISDDPNILEAYQFAVAHPEVLNYMPCYCGCYEEDGHTSNTNCFVDQVKSDVVDLDTMGFG